MNDYNEKFYEMAAREAAAKQFVPGLMAKAFSDADGDKDKTVARYIRLRVDQLSQEFREELEHRQTEEFQRAETERHHREQEERRRAMAHAEPNPSGDPAFDRLRHVSNGSACQFAAVSETMWFCICGHSNPLDRSKKIQNCSACHTNRDFALTNWTRDAMTKTTDHTEHQQSKSKGIIMNEENTNDPHQHKDKKETDSFINPKLNPGGVIAAIIGLIVHVMFFRESLENIGGIIRIIIIAGLGNILWSAAKKK